jgi:integrase
MGYQNASYLRLKGHTFYFSRRVPKRIQKYCPVDRVEVCLHTHLQSTAVRQARILSGELDEQWSILRRKGISDSLSNVFGADTNPSTSKIQAEGLGQLMSAALATYLSLKGDGRPTTFETGSRRAVGYPMEVAGDKPIDLYSRSDANAFREYLKARGLSQESISRNLTSVRAIINFVSKEGGLQPNPAFSGVYLGEPQKKTKRYVPTTIELKQLQSLCRSSDDELRWLVALISDTGLRLSEAIGLSLDDVKIDCPHPQVRVEPKPWRRLKTASSERVVPLVGVALWAAQQAVSSTQSLFLFPSYCSNNFSKANAASAVLNKWLKTNVSEELVVHSLRHALRDRLRAVGCPFDVVDQIGGWSRPGVGEAYGSGYTIDQMANWLTAITQ